jgi:protein-S-isoprenylcysteine O-methyltransferase Ste14
VLKVASKGGFVLMVLALIGLFKREALFSSSPIVIAGQVLALLLMVWARVTFGRRSFHATADPTAGGLVTTGPYRYIRHPIYTAACLFCFVGIAAHWSLISALLGLVMLAGAGIRMFAEETMVVARYPEYRDYAQRTARMIPGVI